MKRPPTWAIVLGTLIVALFLGTFAAWWSAQQSVYHECVARREARIDLVNTLQAGRDEVVATGGEGSPTDVLLLQLIDGLPPVECHPPFLNVF